MEAVQWEALTTVTQFVSLLHPALSKIIPIQPESMIAIQIIVCWKPLFIITHVKQLLDKRIIIDIDI